MAIPEESARIYRLITTSGPTGERVELRPPGPVTLGRRIGHHLELADQRVSRDHATLTYRPEAQGGTGQWHLTDNGSKHGTWLNGVRMKIKRESPLLPGDYIVVGPWTLRMVDESTPEGTGMSVDTYDDAFAGSSVTRLDATETDSLQKRKLRLLLDCAEHIHAARNESELAEAVLEAAVEGTGFVNAAVLRSMSDDGKIDIIAHRGAIFRDEAPQLSRSLIREAAKGSPARLAGAAPKVDQAQSIISLNIGEALCIPMTAGDDLMGFLYLDNRGESPHTQRTAEDAAAFATGLGRLAAMACANLLRIDVEREQARIEAELNAAAESQHVLMPVRTGSFGPFSYIGECRPGRYVGGDFFDVIPLDESRLAVALGDVTGKGVSAAVITTAAKGFLHSALHHHADPADAVAALNRFIEPRCQDDRFLTLWVGVLDAKARTITYLDAGHGYGFMIQPDNSFESLTKAKGGLVGIFPDVHYASATLPLPESGRLLVVSDGLVEQPAPKVSGDTDTDLDLSQFDLDRVKSVITSTPDGEDELEALYNAIEQFAGTQQLADDATALLVRW